MSVSFPAWEDLHEKNGKKDLLCSFEYYIIREEVMIMTIDPQDILNSILSSLEKIDYIRPRESPDIEL